jgi:FtsZ-interacting cell division protein ZipA
MSDLQIGLLVLGLIVIASVVAFNWYQEKRFRRRAEHGFSRPEADVLLGHEQTSQVSHEPTMGAKERIDPHLGAPMQDAEDEPVRTAASRDEERAPVTSSASAVVPMPDPKINYVAEIRAGEVLPASMIQTLDAMLKATGRKCELFGFDYNQQAWLPVTDGDKWYTSIKVFVQLVDRGGAITREQLENIVDLLRDEAKEVSAICETPDIDAAMTAALALDDFSLEVDIIVAARPGQVLHGTQLRALAESSGLTLAPTGVFVMPDGHGGALFSMDNQESNPFRAEDLKNLKTRSVTFLLDVPRTEQGIKVFNKMVAVSKQFADSLDAMLCDDNRAMLNDSGLEKIRNQLRKIYETMDQRGIPAGSKTARQLFS